MRVQNGVTGWTTTRVEIIEYDSFSGPSLFDRREFDSREDAVKFCEEHNKAEGIGSGAPAPETYYEAIIVR